jgi:hypothetical protein
VTLTITARPDAKLISAALRHGLRRTLLTARLAGWAAIGLSLLLGNPVNVPFLIVGVTLSLGIPLLLINNGVRQALRDAHLTTYEISEEGVASSSLESRHAYAWTSFTRVAKLPGQLVFTRGREFLPVPTAGVSQLDIELILRSAAGAGLEIQRA